MSDAPKKQASKFKITFPKRRIQIFLVCMYCEGGERVGRGVGAEDFRKIGWGVASQKIGDQFS